LKTTVKRSLFNVGLVLPHINPFSTGETVYHGDSIQLNCHVSKGDKPLQLHTWTFHGKELSTDMGMVTQKVGDDSLLLTVSSADLMHSGDYQCIAQNRAGRTTYTTEILVHGITLYTVQ
jgi:hypothetical protein